MNNRKICEKLYFNMIEDNNDLLDVPNILNKLKLLQDNHLCSKYDMRLYSRGNFNNMKYITDYLLKKDDGLKKTLITKYTYDKEYKVLPEGLYMLDLSNDKKDRFLVIDLKTTVDENSCGGISLYFIGEDNSKQYNKFVKKYIKSLEKYNGNNTMTEVYDIMADTYNSEVFKSFDSMVFDNKDKILSYIDNWVRNLDKYKKYEITPKLSILIYGPPGTGKTTFAKALAKYLNTNTVTSISQSYFNTAKPPEFYNNNGVVLIDDIDTIANNRDDDTSKDNKEVVGKLLKFLDNPPLTKIKTNDDVYHSVQIIVATTNYYDKLDKAVKRFGRFDLQFEMPDFGKEEAINFCNLYDLRLEDICPKSNNKGFRISPAELQALCISNIDKQLKTKERM
jgi:bcs1 aaa-type ATPase, putative|nr:MAG TPA: Rep protein [Caudoviricetes sp.]DAO68666.1 MAG TPA: Rep protein [Bacteriophage sp.]